MRRKDSRLLWMSVILCLFLSISVYSEGVYEAWVAKYPAGEFSSYGALALAVDYNSNVYITGPSGSDYATIKYGPDGETLWVRHYNGTGDYNDIPWAIAVDKNSNVYVTGSSYGGVSFDFLTIKYAPNGDILWIRRYNGPGTSTDEAFALAVDSASNVFVTGYSYAIGSSYDYATIKYAPDGEILWVRRYDGPVNGIDQSFALALDDSGNVYVTGWSAGGATFQDYATIKYAPNGDCLWVKRFDGPGTYGDSASALAVDASGGVYVTGTSYVGGGDYDYTTVKYTSNGDTSWIRHYNGTGESGAGDFGFALAIDEIGDAFVTGSSQADYCTIKYAPNGDTLLVTRYNGPTNSYDLGYTIAVDSSTNFYVSGLSLQTASIFDISTVKYSPSGDILWVRRYTGSAIFELFPPTIALDNAGNVYVAGLTISENSERDYVTIKYSQCFGKTSGYLSKDNKIDIVDLVYLVNIIFKSWPNPGPTCLADVNGDQTISMADIIYLANHAFKSGPAPVSGGPCCPN